MTPHIYENFLTRLVGSHVLCVGDVMLDRFISGGVSRLSPEAPVPVFVKSGEVAMLGGAGNVARNAAAFGPDVTLIGLRGNDGAGARLECLVMESRITDHTLLTYMTSTTSKTRYVSGGQQMLRVDEEPEPVDDDANDRLTHAIDTAARPSVVLVSDYGKGVVSGRVMDACHFTARGAPVIVDPKGRDWLRYGAVDIIKPNAVELQLFTGLPVETDEEVEAALFAALSRCRADGIVVTRGARGLSYAERVGPAVHVRVDPREVFDVSGAGDTTLAVLGLALVAGFDLGEACALAVKAASIVVGKAGTAVIEPHELLGDDHAGLLSFRDVLPLVKAWRARGLRVGFTNGCFDLLHPGHVQCLEQAREACDRLIVGLNSDASVRRLKGETRPVNSLDARAAVLAGLSSVDVVVAFDDDTPEGLIKALWPDVLIKGGDYREDAIVGADFVSSYGGEVLRTDFIAGHSTTAILERT